MNGITVTNRRLFLAGTAQGHARLLFDSAVGVLCWPVLVFALSCNAVADPNHSLEQIEVRGLRQDTRASSNSASAGLVGNADLAQLALQRPGDVLATIPGMVVTQHSGSGKANQYFLRGFNLDHGTDFAVSLDGMPLNQRSHGHGQGYTDLNVVMPELLQQLSYQKGPYSADAGDFSAAGSVQLAVQNLTRDSLALTVGRFGYQRLLAKGDTRVGAGNLLAGLELQGYDGPWRNVDEDVHKHSALVRYSQPWSGGSLSVMLMSYENRWHAADQVPLRAVQRGELSLFDTVDPSSGGDSRRHSVSVNFKRNDVKASAYYLQQRLQLWSNFSYFLADQTHGDQFEQADDRAVWGGHLEKRLELADWQVRLGLQAHNDDIGNVGLYNTMQRQRLSTVREDQIQQRSQAMYVALQRQWTERWLWQGSARLDAMQIDNRSDFAVNSGHASDQLPTLKTSLGYSLTDEWSLYSAWGQAFHSNDARGVLTQQDPSSGQPLAAVPLLVRTQGGEVGSRFYRQWQEQQGLNLSLAFWQLQLDSELKYIGDAGSNEPSRASTRHGVEFASFYWQDDWQYDLQIAWSQARYDDQLSDEGSAVEGAVPLVVTTAVRYVPSDQWSFALQHRHISGRRLDSQSQYQSRSSNSANVQLAWHINQWLWQLELLNLFNSQDADMSYAYTSQLASETEAQQDIHEHPLEPRSLRLQVRRYF